MESEEATGYRSDAGRILYMSSGHFELQCAAKFLVEQMSTSLRLGMARVERCARYFTGCPRVCLVFRRGNEATRSWIPVDSSWAAWADEAGRCSTRSGFEFIGSRLIESWVAADQVRALFTAEAELYVIVDRSA